MVSHGMNFNIGQSVLAYHIGDIFLLLQRYMFCCN